MCHWQGVDLHDLMLCSSTICYNTLDLQINSRGRYLTADSKHEFFHLNLHLMVYKAVKLAQLLWRAVLLKPSSQIQVKGGKSFVKITRLVTTFNVSFVTIRKSRCTGSFFRWLLLYTEPTVLHPNYKQAKRLSFFFLWVVYTFFFL